MITSAFEAIVNSAIQQMETYAELVAQVTETVDRFMEENISCSGALKYRRVLLQNYLNN